ncbi:MAG: hypothetical protein LBI87_06445 [Candidatus Accumulibacter sp.]|jgi:hypothetical protein|nr:hypothetical protein [Accumulibacter sp.]
MRRKNTGKTMATALAACFGVALGASWPSGLLAAETEARGGREALFGGGDDPFRDAPEKSASPSGGGNGIRGFIQFEMARATRSPAHWSKAATRADFSGNGNLGGGIRWKLGARVDYDAVFDFHDNTYPTAVERNQRFNVHLRENYLDVNAGDWDFRLGKQQVVWGEMVGLFFADVVSARDMREFVLREFDMMRIPQWAARAEYFDGDFHAEWLWIPVASYDLTGKPGADFYPWQPRPSGVRAVYRNEKIPDRTIANSNYGLRLSALKNGWDVSGFAYSSMDVAPTFYRDAASLPGTYVYRARHDRIHQYGGTVSKDFGAFVLKGEVVYTRGRQFTVLRALDGNGVVPQNTLDWAMGLDFNPSAETRFNVQFYQRRYFSHDPDLIADAREDGYSLLLNHKFTDRLEAQALWISSLNRTDWLLRPRVIWAFERNWRLAVGADVFRGPPLGLFGRYDRADRAYAEVRYSF